MTIIDPPKLHLRIPYCRKPEIHPPPRIVRTASLIIDADGLVNEEFQAGPQKISWTGTPVATAPPRFVATMGPLTIGGRTIAPAAVLTGGRVSSAAGRSAPTIPPA